MLNINTREMIVAALAFGTGVFTYDDETNVLTWTILFTASLFDTEEVSASVNGPAGVAAEATETHCRPDAVSRTV